MKTSVVLVPVAGIMGGFVSSLHEFVFPPIFFTVNTHTFKDLR